MSTILTTVGRYAKKFASTTTSYKVDISEQANARVRSNIAKLLREGYQLMRYSFQEYFGISKAPSAIVYRDGKELKKTEGMDPKVMKEIMELLQST